MRREERGEKSEEKRAAHGSSAVAPLASRLSPLFVIATLALALSGCGTTAKRDAGTQAPPTRGGGYYLDDGPGANPPADIDSIPDAVPRMEPIRTATSRPYVVMGRSYTPLTSVQPYKGRGIATWYGRRYHGKPTSSGELYDMYAMTAAHTTLPIPSYARVTNLANGKSVVVRINDRGPFFEGRIVDLSYTAAHKLGVLSGGSAMVEVESVIPGDAGTAVASATPAPKPESAPVAAARASEPVAVPAPAQPAAVAQMPVTNDAAGYYLQLGAFGSKENADNFLERMKAQMGSLADNLHVFARDGLYRVHAGPYPTQPDARQASERISQALGVRTFVLTR